MDREAIVEGLLIFVSIGIVGVLLATCRNPATGTERGACYGNATCNEGLSCLSETCVRLPDGGAALKREGE
jgi:hypothetical protein